MYICTLKNNVMKEFIHIGQRLVLLVLVWILSFIPISIFNSKSSCATGDIFVFAFWIGLFCGLYGVFLAIEAYFLSQKRERGCAIANIVMAIPLLLLLLGALALL